MFQHAIDTMRADGLTSTRYGNSIGGRIVAPVAGG